MTNPKYSWLTFLCLSAGFGMCQLRNYYGDLLHPARAFYFGVAFLTVAALILLLLVGVSLSGETQTAANFRPTKKAYNSLLCGCIAVSLFTFTLCVDGALSPPLSPIPFWLTGAGYAALFVNFWAAGDLWTEYFRARRVIHECGFALEEANNETA